MIVRTIVTISILLLMGLWTLIVVGPPDMPSFTMYKKIEELERLNKKSPASKAGQKEPAGYIPPAAVKAHVQEFFPNAPVMVKVAKCESALQHTNKSGAVLRGEKTPADVGVFQINEPVHRSALKQLGLDPHVLEHNVRFAGYLKQRDGLWPWAMSAYCWDPTEQHIRWKEWCANQPVCRDLAHKRGVTLPAVPKQRVVLSAQLAR